MQNPFWWMSDRWLWKVIHTCLSDWQPLLLNFILIKSASGGLAWWSLPPCLCRSALKLGAELPNCSWWVSLHLARQPRSSVCVRVCEWVKACNITEGFGYSEGRRALFKYHLLYNTEMCRITTSSHTCVSAVVVYHLFVVCVCFLMNLNSLLHPLLISTGVYSLLPADFLRVNSLHMSNRFQSFVVIKGILKAIFREEKSLWNVFRLSLGYKLCFECAF